MSVTSAKGLKFLQGTLLAGLSLPIYLLKKSAFSPPSRSFSYLKSLAEKSFNPIYKFFPFSLFVQMFAKVFCFLQVIKISVSFVLFSHYFPIPEKLKRRIYSSYNLPPATVCRTSYKPFFFSHKNSSKQKRRS